VRLELDLRSGLVVLDVQSRFVIRPTYRSKLAVSEIPRLRNQNLLKHLSEDEFLDVLEFASLKPARSRRSLWDAAR